MSTPPDWAQVLGILAWSAAMTVGVFWQPKWMHRLFDRLVSLFDLLGSKFSRKA